MTSVSKKPRKPPITEEDRATLMVVFHHPGRYAAMSRRDVLRLMLATKRWPKEKTARVLTSCLNRGWLEGFPLDRVSALAKIRTTDGEGGFSAVWFRKRKPKSFAVYRITRRGILETAPF